MGNKKTCCFTPPEEKGKLWLLPFIVTSSTLLQVV
jgi:hypothetical protein